MANSMKLDLKGFDNLLERIKKAGGDINAAAEQALIESAKPFNEDLKAGIEKHRLTGVTEKSMKPLEVKWEGNIATLNVGFDMKKGGLPALFIEYGTPTQKADPFIRPAITKNTPKARKIQKKVLNDILGELEK